jgi:hypothetical protein
MVISGRDAYVNGVPCTQSWGFNRTGSPTRYAASCTGSGTGVTKGNINEAGTMAGIGGNPPVTPGQTVAFRGIADNTVGDAVAYAGNILITSLEIDCDKQAGTPINWTANFGVQGELTPDTVGAADTTWAEHLGASVVADAQVYNGAAYVAFDLFRHWHLAIRAPEKTYVQNGLTYRKPGNLEADVSIDVFNRSLRNAIYDPNVIEKVRLYIDATTFWLVEWVRFTELTGIIFNRGTQDIVGYTINGQWSAVKGTAAGHIDRPDLTHLWGT